MTHLTILAAASASLLGCVDSPDHVVVEIKAPGLDVSQEFDQLEVTITASRTNQGDAVCEPFVFSYSLDTAEAVHVTLPYLLEIQPGSLYDKLIYVRVVGRQDGTTRFKTERAASLLGGDAVITVDIIGDCLGVGTGAGQHCVDGLALASPYAAIFDEGLYVEAGEACRATE